MTKKRKPHNKGQTKVRAYERDAHYRKKPKKKKR